MNSEILLKEARRHIGKPYVYGNSGPNSFDCSGFTSYVYSQIGIKIPRTSRDQGKFGKLISNKKDLQPGDLIFSTNDAGEIYHVVIYSGNDMIIESPRTGLNVRECKLYKWCGIARRVLEDKPSTPSNNPNDIISNDLYYRVTLESFTNRNNAVNFSKDIKTLYNLDTSLVTFVNTDGVLFYRVITGSYKNKSYALDEQIKLKNLGIDSFLSTYIKE